jgi:transposase
MADVAAGAEREVGAVHGDELGDAQAGLQWARGLGSDHVWALEDCRHVSGSFERFLIARRERIVRVPTRLRAD